MKVFALCDSSYHEYEDFRGYIHLFTTKELAEEMLLIHAKHTDSSPEWYSIVEVDIIDTNTHSAFHVEECNYYIYDGTTFQEKKINTLTAYGNDKNEAFLKGNLKIKDVYKESYEVDEVAWNLYLKEHNEYLFEKNQYPPEVKTTKDFYHTVRKLVICRPTTWSKENIQNEWNELLQLAIKLSEKGLEGYEISDELKK